MWAKYALHPCLFLIFGFAAQAQTPILTAQFSNSRTAANLTEGALNITNINSSNFGKVATFDVQGQIYAQPLYVPKMMMNGQSHNVLYVATMRNFVYAFDADSGAELHTVSLGAPVPASTSTALPCPDFNTTGSYLGILSTPVIDPATGSLYVVSATPAGSGGYTHRIFVLDLATLATKAGPVTISPTFRGTGTDSANNQVTMNQTRYVQRPGLLLSHGNVYAGFGSCGPDPAPYHGWVVAFDATSLRQSGVFNTSPNGYEAAIWQSGRGLVGDANGNVYAMVGNGSFDGNTDFANTFLKLSASANILDWFLPPNSDLLESYDLDPSSGGPILTPDTNLLIGGGKDGIVYVLNPSSLGQRGSPVQSFQATHVCDHVSENGCYQIHSSAYLSSVPTPMFYVWGFNDILRSYKRVGGQFVQSATNSSTAAGYAGGMLAVSSLGGLPGTSVLWAVEPSGVVHAFDALNVSTELWNSGQNATRDALGEFSKFGQPVVADGKVFVPTFSNTVVAYGLLPTPGSPGQPIGSSPSPGGDTTVPKVTCEANPSVLWPPNGKSVQVNVSGSMSDADSGLDLGTAAYRVDDEYKEVKANAAITVGAGGAYSIKVSLIAARNGNDSDGRQYSVSIMVKDKAGNLGTCVAPVDVPHDNGH